MKISNRVKRNISLTLVIVGCAIFIARLIQVIETPSSGRAWFELFSICVLTYICFDSFSIYRRRVKRGILFGDK